MGCVVTGIPDNNMQQKVNNNHLTVHTDHKYRLAYLNITTTYPEHFYLKKRIVMSDSEILCLKREVVSSHGQKQKKRKKAQPVFLSFYGQ